MTLGATVQIYIRDIFFNSFRTFRKVRGRHPYLRSLHKIQMRFGVGEILMLPSQGRRLVNGLHNHSDGRSDPGRTCIDQTRGVECGNQVKYKRG